MPPVVVVVVVLDPGRDPGPRLRPGGEVLCPPRPNSTVECQDSMMASPGAEPGLLMDCRTPSRWQACRNRVISTELNTSRAR